MQNKKNKWGMLVITIMAIVLSIWSIVVSYRALELAKWVDSKQENVLDNLIFNKDK
jgi:hypothetical protein